MFVVCEPDDLEGLWNEIWAALLGYRFDPYSNAVEFLEEDAVNQAGQYPWWRTT